MSPLPRLIAWSRLAPTPLAAGEPSPALLVRTRESSTRPALPRLPSIPPLVRPLAKSTTLSRSQLNSSSGLQPKEKPTNRFQPTFSLLLSTPPLAFNPALLLAFNPTQCLVPSILFADDSTLCRTICYPSDRHAAASLLTADLDKITNWSNINGERG